MAAAASRGRVSKDELLRALSKGADIQDEPIGRSISMDEDDQESFHEFLNAPDTEDEEEDVMAKIFSGTGMDADRNVEDNGKLGSKAGLYGGPDTVRQHGDILATYRSTGQMEISLVEQRKAKKLEALRRDLAVKAKLAEDARSAFLDEEQQLRSFKKQAAQGKLLDPARLSYQEGELKKALDHLTECEKAQDLADLELHHIMEEGAKSERICHEEAAHHRAIAAERHDGEAKRADRLLTREEQERQAVQEAQALAEEEAERRAREAKRHQAAGIQRLKGTLATQKERRAELEEVRELRFQHDAQRLLTLKNSVDAVGRQVQSTNEARRKQQERVKAEREERKQRLLDDGRNPYEIWRREEMEAKKEREKQHLAALNEMRSGKLLAQITAEEKRYKKNRKIENEKRKEAEDFQKEVGNYAKEKKVSAYIRKMTIGNVDVLDPTGTALRIDPSKITVQKTHAFGLGRAPPAEIDKVDRDLSRTSKRLQQTQPRPDSVDSLNELGPAVDLGAISSAQDASSNGIGPSMSNASEGEATGKLWTPKLTKLEEQYLAAAKERQKQTIATVQRCWGKEFKGDAFLAKPSIIAFDDFEVGKQYRQVVEVTNVSLTFNQFKLLPLDDKYQEFFEIEFQPPGRMSAGVTRYITIWFLPKVPENIVTTFPILAKTGRVDFPLRCTTKKTILAITPTDFDNNPEVDFGQVLSGEVGTRLLQIKNDGALPAKFECEVVDGDSDFLSMISWSPSKGEFKAHGMTKLSFQFKPTVVGSFSTTLRLHCGNGAAGDAKFEKTYEVVVRGTCVDVPIYVEKEEYDLKTCIFGHIFRENVVVHNRRSVPMKITVEKPKHIEGQLQINPTLAYVQGNKEQVIQVKFSPKDDFLDRHQQYRDASRKGITGAFRIPVTIVGAEQVLPVHTVLVGTLTTNNISFQPSVLNFGRVFVGSTASARMLMVNESMLPQRYVFTRLPSFLTVMKVPSDVIQEEEADRTGVQSAVLDGGLDGAFGTLLPGERRQVSVAYTPQSATEMNVRMQLKAITGQLSAREFAVSCQGQGIAPLVELSNTTVQLAAIPSGSASKESVVIRNCSKIPYTMNLVLPSPALAGLKASPVCTTLAPGQSQRIQLEFWATEDYVNLLTPKPPEQETPAEEDEESAAKAADAAKEQHQQEVSREIRRHGGRRWENEETRSIHANWKLACFLRPEGGKTATKANEAGTSKKENQIVYISVSTCVLPPILTATPAVLDFGEVTAQQRKLLPLTFEAEAGVEPQQLKLDALPQNACFTVLSAARTVSNKPFQLMVEFHPQQVQIYQTSLLVRTQSTQFQVPLLGRGVRPVLKIEPEDGILRLGAVTFGAEGKDNTQEKLTIKNDSPFELRFSLETIASADPNHTGPSPFSMSPSIGVVEAHGSKVVTVTFRPHRPLTVFKEKVLVNVPNQKEPTFVYLYGHCFKHQVYALPDLPFSPFLVSTASRPPALSDSMAVGIGSGANADTGDFEYPQAQQLDFSLKFGEGERSQCLLIGACVPPGFPTAPQNTPAPAYEFQIIQSDYSKYFTLEAPEGGKPDKAGKGQVVPGKPPIRVAFKYTPEENTKLTYGDVSLDLLRGIGQWITCQVRGGLSGGFVPPGASPTQELKIELRAYLQQI